MTGIKEKLAFLSWFPLTGEKLKADFIAGITVALLLIPQSMAYADLAGLPYIYGLNAAFLPVIIGAMFGRSFHLSTGPVAMTSMLCASLLGMFAPPGSPEYISLALVLAILIGFLRIVIGLLKLTRLSQLISHPIILGFTNGAAILIGFSQISKVTGIEMERYQGIFGTFRSFIDLLHHLQDIHFPTIIMTVLAALLIVLFNKIKRIPSVLAAVVICTLISFFIGYNQVWNGEIIGEIPKGLPRVGLPDHLPPWPQLWPILLEMIPLGLAIVLIGFLEVFSVTKAVSQQSGQRMNYDLEMIGQGLASIAAGISHGYTVSGSLSRTALCHMAGGKSGFAQIITGLTVLLALIFLTPFMYHLPGAVLAVSIMMAVKRLIKIKEMFSFFSFSKRDFFLSFITFILTLLMAPNMIFGILVGILLSLIITATFDLKGGFSAPQKDGNVLALRIRRNLLFTQINQLEDVFIEWYQQHEDIQYLEIRGRTLNKVDISGLEGFKHIAKKLEERKGALVFVGLPPAMVRYIKRLNQENMIFFHKEEYFLHYLSKNR